MKKKICLMLCLLLITCLTIGGTCGCSTKRSSQNQPAGVNDVLEQGMAAEDSKNAAESEEAAQSSASEDSEDVESEAPAAEEPSDEPEEEVSESDTEAEPAEASDDLDVDLTTLSSTMVYSEVFSMLTSPDDYVGKTVKMEGLFAYYHDEVTDNQYFACVIQDATACCSQGLEFILTDDYHYPEDYPEVNEEICVVGVFDTYQEGDITYCTLRDAKLI